MNRFVSLVLCVAVGIPTCAVAYPPRKSNEEIDREYREYVTRNLEWLRKKYDELRSTIAQIKRSPASSYSKQQQLRSLEDEFAKRNKEIEAAIKRIRSRASMRSKLVDDRIGKLERDLASAKRVLALTQSFDTRLATLNYSMQRLSIDLSASVKQIREDLAELSSRVDSNEAENAVQNQRLDALESRLRENERLKNELEESQSRRRVAENLLKQYDPPSTTSGFDNAFLSANGDGTYRLSQTKLMSKTRLRGVYELYDARTRLRIGSFRISIYNSSNSATGFFNGTSVPRTGISVTLR